MMKEIFMKSCRLRMANVSGKEFRSAYHTCFSHEPVHFLQNSVFKLY